MVRAMDSKIKRSGSKPGQCRYVVVCAKTLFLWNLEVCVAWPNADSVEVELGATTVTHVGPRSPKIKTSITSGLRLQFFILREFWSVLKCD